MIALTVVRLVVFFAALAVASVGLLAAVAAHADGPSFSAVTAEATTNGTDAAPSASAPNVSPEPYPFEVVCEEREAPALSCAEIVERVLDLMGTNASSSIASMMARPLCDPACRPGGSASVMSVSGSLLEVGFLPDGTWQMTSSETHVPEPDAWDEVPDEEPSEEPEP